jgi:hypothetical protein
MLRHFHIISGGNKVERGHMENTKRIQLMCFTPVLFCGRDRDPEHGRVDGDVVGDVVTVARHYHDLLRLEIGLCWKKKKTRSRVTLILE